MKTGDVKDRRTVVDFSDQDQPGDPDGMAVDADGMIWVAHWGGYRITRWNPATGRLLERVALPAAHVTSCCFGGRDLDELYVTTARTGLDQEALSQEPLSGDLFRESCGQGTAHIRLRWMMKEGGGCCIESLIRSFHHIFGLRAESLALRTNLLVKIVFSRLGRAGPNPRVGIYLLWFKSYPSKKGY